MLVSYWCPTVTVLAHSTAFLESGATVTPLLSFPVSEGPAARIKARIRPELPVAVGISTCF